MTISATPRRNDYTGNGAVNVYDYDFKIFHQADIRVIVADLLGVEYPDLALGVDFSISGVGDAAGGSITLINAAQAWLTAGKLTTGFTITLLGAKTPVQTTSIRNQGSYYPADIENEFDKQLILIQELSEKLDRAILAAASSSISGIIIDPPVALQYLRWDVTATKIESTATVATVNSIYGEAPTGALDNTNMDFTLAHVPSVLKAVYVNGVRRKDFTRLGAVISLSAPAGFNGEVLVDYDY